MDADFHDHNHASARCGDVLVIVWRGTTTPGAVQRLRERLASLGKARQAGIGLLTIVETGAVLPSNEARNHLARMLREAHQVRAWRCASRATGSVPPPCVGSWRA